MLAITVPPVEQFDAFCRQVSAVQTGRPSGHILLHREPYGSQLGHLGHLDHPVHWTAMVSPSDLQGNPHHHICPAGRDSNEVTHKLTGSFLLSH